MKTEVTLPENIKELAKMAHSPIRWPENPTSKLSFLELEIPGKTLSEIISEERGNSSVA